MDASAPPARESRNLKSHSYLQHTILDTAYIGINSRDVAEEKKNKKNHFTYLVVFHSQVVSSSFQVSYLHEVSCKHSLPYVDIVVAAVEISAAQLEVEPGHDTH